MMMERLETTITGRALALKMSAAFPGTDWVGLMKDRAGVSRDYVEWHLQEDMTPPDAILAAADALLRQTPGTH